MQLVLVEASRSSAVQREKSVAAGGRTHGKRNLADVRLDSWRRPERQLYEVLLT